MLVSFFFCCIAELAIKPCRSSRSKLRGEFGIPNTCKTGNKNTTKQQTPPNPKHNTKQKTGKCLECETRGEKRVKRPKRPNALICRTPGGSIRYPLSSSLGMMLISHSIVSIPASPSRLAIWAGGSCIIILERRVSYIRQGSPLDTVRTFLGLPSTCM